METPHLNEAIEQLKGLYERVGANSTKEKLREYKAIKKALSIHSVSKSNIAIGDYVWYNERIHKVQKIRFDDEFWQGKEIAIIDIEAKVTVDVSTKNLRYVC